MTVEAEKQDVDSAAVPSKPVVRVEELLSAAKEIAPILVEVAAKRFCARQSVFELFRKSAQ